jgi:hypothetical protein
MTTATKTQETLLKSISTDLDEISFLAKSYFEKAEGAAPDAEGDLLHAAEEGQPEETLEGYAKNLSEEEILQILEALVGEMEGRGGQAPEGMEGPGHEGGESPMQEQDEGPEGMMDKAGGLPPEAAPGGDMPPGQESMPDMPPSEGAGIPDEELRQMVSQLSQEEQMKLLQVLQEMAQGGGQAPAPAPQAAPQAGAPAMAEKSFKLPKVSGGDKADGSVEKGGSGDFTKLAKSVNEVLERISTIEKNIAPAKKEQLPARTYADSKLAVLEKSEQEAPVLDGMALANWLVNEQRKGNRLVKSMYVTKANLAKSEEDVSELYKELQALGVTLPK